MNKNIINLIDKDFHIRPKDDDLYSMVRLDDINRYKDIVNLKKINDVFSEVE